MATPAGTPAPPNVPQELYNAIVPFCDGDWKALRLVNKGFEADATKYLFKVLTVCLQERSMKRLVDVSKSKRLSQHVQSLRIGEEQVRLLHQAPFAFIYGMQRTFLGYHEQQGINPHGYTADGKALPYEICYQEYRSIIGTLDFLTTPYPVELQAIMHRCDAYQLYKKEGDMIFKEAKFLAREQEVECLKEALSNFLNLASIHILAHSDNATSTSPSWGTVTTTVLHPYDQHNGYRGYNMYDRRLKLYMKVAALIKQRGIKELIIEDSVVGHREVNLLEVANQDVLTARPVFAHIIHLDIPVGKYGLPYEFDEDRNPEIDLDVRPHKLANLLRGLPLLETLALRNKCSRGHKAQRIQIWPALAAIRPGNLKLISLECCILKLSVLKNFFVDHSKSLEHVSLNRTYLLGGKFQEMFEEMRQQLKLKSLTLASFLVELMSTWEFYLDFPESSIDAFRDLIRTGISDYVTHRSSYLPEHFPEEDGPFGEGFFPGALQALGRADFPDEDSDYEADLEMAEIVNIEYPNRVEESYVDDEKVTNHHIAAYESVPRHPDLERCKNLIKVAEDGSMTGEEAFDAAILQEIAASNYSKTLAERKHRLRLDGWML